MKFFLSILAAVTFLAFTPACDTKGRTPDPEEPCFFQQNIYQQRVSWAVRPIVMYADLSLTADQAESAQKAIEIWNDTFRVDFGGKDVFVYGGQLKEARGFTKDRMNVISKADVWPGKPTEQAETELNWTDNRATEADIRLNGNLKLSVDDNIRGDEADAVALIVHELGHVLGLGHIESTEYTAMAPKLANGSANRRVIGDIDVDALRCEY